MSICLPIETAESNEPQFARLTLQGLQKGEYQLNGAMALPFCCIWLPKD